MNLFQKMGRALPPFVQWAIYRTVWIVGFTFAIAACLMGLSPFLVDEAGREFLKQHWLISGIIFMMINAGAMGFFLLKSYLERRWPHVAYL
ncbi:MAG: hypothetical protein G01um101456_117 [Parcubacteria group bacterium Gr01-1014_56]|nr:MAG: hypothetical protein G01um101456_117 [Parcubacteria group bacterium Gr01-1014_56]